MNDSLPEKKGHRQLRPAIVIFEGASWKLTAADDVSKIGKVRIRKNEDHRSLCIFFSFIFAK